MGGTLSSGEMLVQHTTTPLRGWEGSKRTWSDEGDPARDEDAGWLDMFVALPGCLCGTENETKQRNTEGNLLGVNCEYWWTANTSTACGCQRAARRVGT